MRTGFKFCSFKLVYRYATENSNGNGSGEFGSNGAGVDGVDGGGGRSGWRGTGGLRDGLLLRFAVGDGGLTVKDGLPVAADLAYEVGLYSLPIA